MSRLLLAAALLLAPELACASDLPPPRFDHPFHGKLIIKHEPMSPSWYGWTYGRQGKVCVIHINSQRPMSREQHAITVRHEIGHCNGWDINHSW
jgi:hypothetical protein